MDPVISVEAFSSQVEKRGWLEKATKGLLGGSREPKSPETAPVVASMLSFPDPEMLRAPPAMASVT
ncbi:MAG: hypothetical protein ACK45D_04330 [Alphaproteobacteria bacterium]